MRKFLQSRVVNGGAIPKFSQLRDYNLFDVYEVEKAELKQRIKGKDISLLVDEVDDDEGRYVLDVMAVILDFDYLSPSGRSVVYLLDTHFLSASNNKTISQAVVRTVHEFGIDFDNIRVFNSDNVSYMKKAFNETLCNLFTLAVFIPCNSHVINLVASDFKKTFVELSEFMKCFRNLFFAPSGRKGRLMNFLHSRTATKTKMPPNPTTKSWRAWFDSAIYYAEYILVLEDFVLEEVARGRNAACSSLLRLEEIYAKPELMTILHAQLKLVKEKAPTILSCLNYFQERIPHTTAVYGVMNQLLYYLEVNANAKEDDFSFCFEGSPYSVWSDVRVAVIDSAKTAFKAALSKLTKYVLDGEQQAMPFFEQVRILDPANIVDCDLTYGSIDSIPGIESVSKQEWELYVKHIGPQSVKSLGYGDNIDLKLFWKSKATSLPALYRLASCYCTTTTGSYDVGRSFSAYNAMLDDKRRSLTTDTIKATHFLNWNLRVKSAVEEEVLSQENSDPKPKTRRAPDVIKITQTGPQETREKTSQIANNQNVGSSETSPKMTQLQPNATKTSAKAGIKRKSTNQNQNKKWRKSVDIGLVFRNALPKTTATSYPPINYGLSREVASLMSKEEVCVFPSYKEPLLQYLLEYTTKFSGGALINQEDLKALVGGNARDEDNYLSAFVIDAYLERLANDCTSAGTKAQSIATKIFQRSVHPSFSVMNQDVVFVPLLSRGIASNHWTLLVVKPGDQEIIVLDSSAINQVKASAQKAVYQMCDLLTKADPNLDLGQWRFSTNAGHQIPQQPNGYDCGAYVCAYARCLVLKVSY